jgi:hypothetical protein
MHQEVNSFLQIKVAMPELKDITCDEELARWMGLKALGRSITNFTRLVDACIRMLEQDNHRKIRF